MAERFTWPDLLSSLLAGTDLSVSESTVGHAAGHGRRGDALAARGIPDGAAGEGRDVEEIVGFRDAILEAAVPLPVRAEVLDIVGTGETATAP